MTGSCSDYQRYQPRLTPLEDSADFDQRIGDRADKIIIKLEKMKEELNSLNDEYYSGVVKEAIDVIKELTYNY